MKKLLPIFIFVFVVAAVVGIGYAITRSKNTSTSPQMFSSSQNVSDSGTVKGVEDNSGIDAVALAKYLTEKGAVFYGSYTCSHCEKQKETLGDGLKYINYVECNPQGENAQPDKCTAAGIEGYPTWIINGQKTTGAKSLSELTQLSGYQK